MKLPKINSWRKRIFNGHYKAHKVHTTIENRYLKADLVNKPVWFDAVKMYPPIPVKQLRDDKTRFTAPFSDEEKIPENTPQDRRDFHKIRNPTQRNILEAYCLGLHTSKWLKYNRTGGRRWNEAVTEASKIYKFPQDIKFPEDEWFDRFYREHPVEKFKPKLLKRIEDENPDEKTIDSGAKVIALIWKLRIKNHLKNFMNA
jgi:hypothetical protein